MHKNEAPSLSELFLTFLWIGFTAFGGLAMTAHIRKHVVDKKQWLREETFDSGLALCQLIPGAIVMQLVAYIGLKLRGARGALVCFLAFGFPSFLIMFILSLLYKELKNISTVELILNGLRVIIVAIVAQATFTFGRKNLHTINDWLIALLAAALFLVKLHPVIVLFVAALLGIALGKRVPPGIGEKVGMKTFRFFLLCLSVVLVTLGLLFLIHRDYFILATIMLRIDLVSFGGGLAAIPVMYHEMVDLFGWFDKKMFMDGIILGQVTPGSIIIAAAFFGFMHFGLLGSILSTAFVFTPSFLILIGIIPFFDKLKSYSQFNKVINGILCAFVGLLAVVTYHFSLDISWSWIKVAIAALSFLLMWRKVDVIWIILGGVALSFLPV